MQDIVLFNRLVAEKGGRTSAAYINELADTQLKQAEKLPDGCQRDRTYAAAAMFMKTDYQRALDISERIKDLTLRENLRQYIYYGMANAAIRENDLSQAQEYAKRVTIPEQRTLLYGKMAGVALRRKDRALAGDLLGETRHWAERVPEPSTRASIWLAAAAGFAEIDPVQAREILRDAIKAVNQVPDQNVDTFRVSRIVNLACAGDQNPGHRLGSLADAERFSLFETLATIAPSDVDGTVLIATGIEDASTRIRALAAIAKAMTKETLRRTD
jgi:hypothetical protein